VRPCCSWENRLPSSTSLIEDVQGLIIGTTLMALSVQFLRAAELFTGQIAGLSLIGSYATGWSFGAIFFVLNLPFYLLAIRAGRLGFTVRTLIAVALVSVLVDGMPLFFTLPPLPPAVGAILFGILAGVGLVTLFRHGATLGGVGIVALWLQDERAFPAGRTQLIFDAFVFALALPCSTGNGGGLVAAGRRDREPDRDGEPPARPVRGAILTAWGRAPLDTGAKLTTLRASSKKEPVAWPPRRPFPATSSSSHGATCARAAPKEA
jgi:hypothetical protein